MNKAELWVFVLLFSIIQYTEISNKANCLGIISVHCQLHAGGEKRQIASTNIPLLLGGDISLLSGAKTAVDFIV